MQCLEECGKVPFLESLEDYRKVWKNKLRDVSKNVTLKEI